MEIYEAITIHLVHKIGPITQTQWNKLMFFIDGLGACQNKNFTKIDYVKLPYGPVPNNYSELITKMHYREIIYVERFENGRIELAELGNNKQNQNEAKEILKKKETLEKDINKIVEIFRDWTASNLSNFTHKLDVWKKPVMYSVINLKDLKNDSFLEKKFGEKNFYKLIYS